MQTYALTMIRTFHLLIALFTALMPGLCSVSVADDADSIVVLKTSKSLEQVVTEELQLERFIQQIATYNNITNVTVPLPVGASVAVPQPYIKTTQFGRIAYVKGDVTHKQTDLVVNPPTKGNQVFQGDIIQTGTDGFVSMTFKSGARVHVQPESRVVVDNIDCITDESECVISLTATDGQVASEVTPRADSKPPVQFSIDTPFLTAAVRGTAFYVDVDDIENKIGVTKGLVATEGGGQSNDLPKGKGLTLSQGAAPELVDLLEPPELGVSGDKLLLSEQDTINWLALPGARSYRAELAVDENLSQRVSSQTTADLTIDVPSLTPGDYYLSLAAIDDKDFLGLPALQSIAVAELVDEKPALVITRQDGVTKLSVAGYDGRLELLISNSVNATTATSRILENASQALSLRLDETKEWVFRARKILDAYQVSPYSEYYVFSAREE